MNGNRIFNRTTLSASALKTIALVTMLIDHLGMTVVYELEQRYLPNAGPDGLISAFLRLIGRIAFIIFAFLLVEGFINTSNRKKYVLRLLAGAVVSEIPFDLAGSMKWFDPWDQNIFFTLTIGFCTIWALDVLREMRGEAGSASGNGKGDYTGIHLNSKEIRASEKSPLTSEEKRVSADSTIGIACGKVPVIYTVAGILTVLTGMVIAELIRCDYGCMGIGLIVVFYLFRWRSSLFWAVLIETYIGHIVEDFIYYMVKLFRYYTQIGEPFRAPGVNAVLVNLSKWASNRLIWNMPGILAAVLLIMHYNGEKGRQLPKAFYYLFYPVHLSILYLIMRFCL